MNLIPPPSTLPPGSTVWAYLRDSGGDNQDRSITRQLEVIQDYCARHRLELVHVYRDEAKSGTTTAGRDDFMRMIAQSDKHENNPDGLLLWSFSRFGRNLDDATYYKSRLRRNDIIIHSLTDQIPEGPYSRFVETLVDIARPPSMQGMDCDRWSCRELCQALPHSASSGSLWPPSTPAPVNRARITGGNPTKI
jgi:hypothetical protein